MAEFNQFPCSQSDLVSGSSPCGDVNIGAPEKIFLTSLDFHFDTITLAKTEASHTAGIASEDIFPIPLVEEYSNDSEEDTYYTSNVTSLQTFIREGKKAFSLMIKFNPSLHARLRAGVNGRAMRMYWVDSTKNIVGTSPDGIVFKGWKSGTLRVEKWQPSDGSNLSFTKIKFVAESTVETEDKIAIFPVDWDVKALNGIIPASLTVVGTPNATTLVVDVATSDSGTAIEGLLVGDFSFIEAAGTAETITVAAESATIPGRYTLTAVAFVTGTINLDGVVTLVGENYKGTATAVTIA